MKLRVTIRGYTFVEILIVLAISAVLAALAFSSYSDSIAATRRNDATSALARLAVRQELFRLQHQRYAAAAEREAAPPNGLGMPATEHGWYQLELQAAGGSFSATATAREDAAQRNDAECWRFGIDALGRRWALRRDGSDSSARCWRS